MVVPQNHRCQSSNGLMTWMVWGYPHFRKYPYIYIYVFTLFHTYSFLFPKYLPHIYILCYISIHIPLCYLDVIPLCNWELPGTRAPG